MAKQSIGIMIPALKKNIAFPDDLVKKLAGKSLVHRAIEKALNIVPAEKVCILTDSEEISLIAKRNEVSFLYNPNFQFSRVNYLDAVRQMESHLNRPSFLVVLWAYSPLLESDEILNALDSLSTSNSDTIIAVKEEFHRILKRSSQDLFEVLEHSDMERFYVQVKAFQIFKASALQKESKLQIVPHILGPDSLEIESVQDWWVCEKLLRRKRIIMNVIGYPEVGMGHIYRTLSLAHEISNHQIEFVCDTKSKVAVNKLTGYEYPVHIVDNEAITKKLISLRPHMVINDVLNTSESNIRELKKANILVVNFEDLGPGALLADLVINELFDEPKLEGDHFKWGHNFFFLRDEFNDAKPLQFQDQVKRILITFGGTDPENLTLYTLESILDDVITNEISVSIVTGAGYEHRELLRTFLESLDYKKITYTSATGVISHIMEQCQIAICSNGRTVYELAHMNIPSIVIAQHEREGTHRFSTITNGFSYLGVVNKDATRISLTKEFSKLLNDRSYRLSLYQRLTPFDFTKSKPSVIKLISDLLDEEL